MTEGRVRGSGSSPRASRRAASFVTFVALIAATPALFDGVAAAATVPGAPTIGTATAGDKEATVTWTAPASSGGAPITGYVVTPYVGYVPLAPVTFDSTATTQVVTGLTNGTQYRFKVQAKNASGLGARSQASNAVTPPPATPGAPTIGTATAGDQEATLTWTAPRWSGESPITGYVVTPYVGYVALAPVTFDSTATTQVVTGLTNGTQYRFKVQAKNASGLGARSQASNAVTLTRSEPGGTPTTTPTTAPARPTADGEVVVAVGESFWVIADNAVTSAKGGSPEVRELTKYWLRLIEANRDRLVERDNPDLLFPGQTLVLPAIVPVTGEGASTAAAAPAVALATDKVRVTRTVRGTPDSQSRGAGGSAAPGAALLPTDVHSFGHCAATLVTEAAPARVRDGGAVRPCGQAVGSSDRAGRRPGVRAPRGCAELVVPADPRGSRCVPVPSSFA